MDIVPNTLKYTYSRYFQVRYEYIWLKHDDDDGYDSIALL